LHILKDSSIPTALVFTRTKHGADKVAQGLVRAGIRAEAIHGNKSQNARQRALENFKSRHTRILVATDIAARGIDIDELTHVINFELPNVPETYIHRIGRTGRAGASGIALSFCDQEEKEFLQDIQKLIARAIPVVEDHPHVMQANFSYRAPVVVSTPAGGRNGSGNGRREPGGAGNGRREQSGSGNGSRGRTGQPESKRPEVKRPEIKKQEDGKRPEVNRQEVKRPEIKRNEGVKRQEDVKRPEEVKRHDDVKRHEEVKRPEPKREKHSSEDPAFPFRVNRSEGDEKW